MDQKKLAEWLRWDKPYLYHPTHPLWKFVVVATVTIGGMSVLMDLLGSAMVMTQFQGFLAVDYDKIIWAARGVLFVLAISPLFALRLSRRFGTKKVFFIGLWLFLGGAVATGFAPNYPVFMICRVVGGLGGGLISSLGLTIINQTITDVENRRSVVAAYSSVSFGLGIAFGMIMGGYYGQMAAWRMVFFSALYCIPPLMVATCLFFPETKQREQPPYDIFGLASLILLCLSLLFIVTQVKAEWNTLAWRSNFIIGCGIVSFISLVLFVANALTRSNPLIELRLFLDRKFSTCCLSMLIVGFLVFGVTLASLGMMQIFYGYEWIRLGWFMSIVGFTYFFVGAIPTLTIRYINPRVYVYGGLLIIALSCLFAQSITIQSNKYEIGMIIFMRSTGVALTLGPLTIHALSSFDRAFYPKGASIINFIRMLGGVFGSALIQLISAYRTPFHSLRFGEMVDVQSAEYRRYFYEYWQTAVSARGSSPKLGAEQTREIIIQWIQDQAKIAALLDAEYLLGMAIFTMLGLHLFFYLLRISRDQSPLILSILR